MTGVSRPAMLVEDAMGRSRSSSPWLQRRFSSSSSASTGPNRSTSSSLPATKITAPGNARSPSLLSSACSSLSSTSTSSPHSFSPIHPEPDKRGNLEYKLRILPVTASRFSRLVTQLKWRLAEGGGLAVYEIGVLDDGTLIGLPQEDMRGSLTQLAMMGKALGADCEVRRCILVERGSITQDDAEQGVSLDTPTTMGDSSTATPHLRSPHLLPYRHRLGSSSKNQSPGLDNIVGLRALGNDEAAKVLGTSHDEGHLPRWTFRIATSDSEGDDSATDARTTPTSSAPDTGTGTPVAEDPGSNDEEDGFAFSLSLSDDDDGQIGSSSKAMAKLTRRQSHSISNSPWHDRTPDFSPAGGRGSPLLLTTSQTSGSVSKELLPAASVIGPNVVCTDASINSDEHLDKLAASTSTHPGDRSGSPGLDETPKANPPKSATALQTQQRQQSHRFTDLSGLDVEGVLQFSLQPKLLDHTKKPKKRSGRRSRAERERIEALLFSPCDEQARQEVEASSSSTEESKSNVPPSAKHSKLSIKSQYSRGPRLERRARRLAELKAREREGEGLLLALDSVECDTSPAKLAERLKWWRYSGLRFEDELPYYDSVRQSWVREVAEWLTVDEMRELAKCWDPQRGRRGSHEGEDGFQLDEGNAETTSSMPCDTIADLANGVPSEEGPITKRAANRRRRKERRRNIEDDQGRDRGNNHPFYRPEFAPPPSSAVNIPSGSSRTSPSTFIRSGSHRHPLSRSQFSSLSDGEEEEEEDSFSMGLTLNIDEIPEGIPAKPGPSSMRSSDHASASVTVEGGTSTPAEATIATSPSPSAASTITSLGRGGSSSSPPTAIGSPSASNPPSMLAATLDSPSAQRLADPSQLISDGARIGKMRFIVEAVLSLRLRGSERETKVKKSPPSRDMTGSCGSGLNGTLEPSLRSASTDVEEEREEAEGKEGDGYEYADEDEDEDEEDHGMSGWSLD